MPDTIVIDATPELSDLIDRVPLGGEIVIERAGRPAARLSVIATRTGKGVTPELLAWLKEHRVRANGPTNAIELVRAMRDGDWPSEPTSTPASS